MGADCLCVVSCLMFVVVSIDVVVLSSYATVVHVLMMYVVAFVRRCSFHVAV